MKRNDSIVYIGFDFNVKRAYYGMVHARRPHEQSEEHRRATLRHSAHIASEIEMKYEYMARHGGAASWFFLPYIILSCRQVIDRHRLQSESGAENDFPTLECTEQDAASQFSVQACTESRTSRF